MKKSTRSIILATFGFLSFWILSHFILNRGRLELIHRTAIQQPPRSALAITSRFRGNKDKHRIAIVIPFFGESPEAIPSYLRLFCTAAAGSASLVDFLLIHNGVLEAYTEPTPPNVIFINIGSTQAFAERLVRVVDKKRGDLAVTVTTTSSSRLSRTIFINTHTSWWNSNQPLDTFLVIC